MTLTAVVCALGVSIAASNAVPTETFALVVANNQPSAASALPSLRYADDDGARFYELFQLVTATVVLHSVLDDETQRLHPRVAGASRPPTIAHVDRSLRSLYAKIQAAHEAGHRTEFYFIFVGHGSAGDNGEGLMHFLDGEFSRSDLFHRVISKSPADLNHIIIDACNAFLFVAGRGESRESRIRRAVDQYLADETIAQHPNTGFLLSTSAATEVHEWSGFRAGVFSHEVRSALMGGADVDGNGAVTYPEVAAFLEAANKRVSDPRGRLEPWISAPQMLQQAALFDQTRTREPRSQVKIDGRLDGRWSVQDERGVRLADLHIAADGPVTLVLPSVRNHVLLGPQREIVLPTSMSRFLEARHLTAQPRDIEARGSLAHSYRRDLFAVPFGRGFYEGYASRPASHVVPEPSLQSKVQFNDHGAARWAGGALVVAGIAAVVTGGVMAAQALENAAAYRTEIGFRSDLSDRRSRAERQGLVSAVLIGLGAASTAGGLILVW